MIKVSRLGTYMGLFELNGYLLGLKFNEWKYAILAYYDDFQHLATIQHKRIPKRYWYMM